MEGDGREGDSGGPGQGGGLGLGPGIELGSGVAREGQVGRGMGPGWEGGREAGRSAKAGLGRNVKARGQVGPDQGVSLVSQEIMGDNLSNKPKPGQD